MKRIIIFFSLLYNLAFPVLAQQYKFPLKISPNKRYLIDNGGKPFFINGDTGWKLFLKLNKREVIDYLQDRKNKRFTVIQTMLTGFKGELNISGQAPFANPDNFETLNQTYFDHVEWVLKQADSLGLIVAIAPLWAGCCGEGFAGKSSINSKSAMDTNGPVKSRAFGEWLGKRFSQFNNIIWILGGDIDPLEDRENINQFASGIKSQAPRQFMTYHASSTHSSSDVWENTSWLDIVMTYTYFRGFNKAWKKDQPDVYEVNYKEYQKTPVKPFFLGESTYEGEHGSWGSAVQARKQAYWSVLSGGTGNAYGSPIWNFPKDWKTYLNLPGGNSMEYFYNLFITRPWFDILPDYDSKLIKAGAGVYAENDLAIAGADKNGRFMIVYIPSGRTFKIDTDKIKGSMIKASWYNPRTGKSVSIGNLKKDKVLSFKTPDENDWVLILDDLQSKLIMPGLQ